MQSFKEIPYQNYIELKFSTKNLNELSQQEALIKYKRNAQLLAEIFIFDKQKRQIFKSQDTFTQNQVDKLIKDIEQEECTNKERIEAIKQKSKEYEVINNLIKQLSSKEQMSELINQLKKQDLYDDCHPFFVQGSPFYLSTTEQRYLEVDKVEPPSEEGLNLLELN